MFSMWQFVFDSHQFHHSHSFKHLSWNIFLGFINFNPYLKNVKITIDWLKNSFGIFSVTSIFSSIFRLKSMGVFGRDINESWVILCCPWKTLAAAFCIFSLFFLLFCPTIFQNNHYITVSSVVSMVAISALLFNDFSFISS